MTGAFPGMEVDYDPDEERPASIAQAVPAGEKAKAQEELGNLSDQASQSLLDLLEAQKVSHQSLLAKLEKIEAQRVSENQRSQLLDALLNRDPGFEAQLAALPVPVLTEVCDSQGMSLIHHAVRTGQANIVDLLLQRCPELAEKTTGIDARQARGTPLMVLMDTPVHSVGEDIYQRILRLLLHVMSVQSICAQAYNGQTAAHLAAAQANLMAIKKICWTTYKKAGESDSAFRLVSNMLNTRSGKRGAGAVDLALNTNFQVASYLKSWGAEEQCPNPKQRRYWYT